MKSYDGADRDAPSTVGMGGKASAIAYPIQGLVKYHGLKDAKQRIPYHDSISLCTGPIHTHTTIQVLDHGPTMVTIDGKAVTGKPLDRVLAVMDKVRDHAHDDRPFKMVSKSDFPQFVGLGSSSSGFAALAVAGAAAYGWKANLESLSEVARLGAGSASRAVTGGISEWVAEEAGRSYSRGILGPEDLMDWRIVVPLVPHPEPTDGMHAEAATSPLFEARVEHMESELAAMRVACGRRDLRAIQQIAERDTLNLHAVTMTGERGHVIWKPATLEVIHKVRELRDAGVPVWFSIDTGATAYLNTDAANESKVAAAVRGIAGVERLIFLRPAGPAHTVDRHLF